MNQNVSRPAFARWAAALVLALAGGAAQATDVGVSISISQPGVYGRIDIGQYPQPVLVRPQPVRIAPAPYVVVQPVYLWVPPGHQKHWSKHCKSYNACGVPVYFVQEQWYQDHVMVRANSHGEKGKGHGKGHDK
jgi:hypothetical protein